MVATTSHIFSGKVDIASNLQVGSSHLFVDTENDRVGITTASPDATLHVNGNVYATRFEGDGSLLTGIASNLEQITNNGNVTSNAVQFTNPDTGIITTGNVNIGNKLSVASLTSGTVPYVDGNKTLVDSHITQGTDKVSITSNLEITGNILMSGETYKIDSQSLEVKDRIVGIAYDNTLSGADTGILMEYPTKNIGLIHHGASGNPYAQEFTIGYTQNTATDTTILNDPANKITVNVLGDLHTQNNMTVDSGGSYFGDGTTLTGVALETDMTSNAARIANIETVNGTQTGLITGLRTDVTSNASRITTLETANTVQAGLITSIKSDVTSNTARIATLEAANTVQAGLITAIETDVTDNAARITTLEDANTVQAGLITAIETDVTDNAARITTLEAANTVQAGLITAIETDVTDNAARITTLEAANTVQAGLITAIETDVTDNAARITTLEDANTVQAGLITAIETDVADNAARITNLDTDLSDNASRVSVLEATDAVYAGLLTGLRTDVDDNASRISNLTFNDVVNVNNATSNTVQFTNPTTALTTDLISNVGIKVDQLHNVNFVTPLTDQLLVYDGTDWVNDYPRHTYIQIRNDTTGTIDAGDAVYVKGTHNANILNVGLADSSDPTKMPSVGLSNQVLLAGQQGTAVAYGKALNVATGTFIEGETVYVSNTVPGGLSNVKPFNNDLIQNIGLVTKIHPTNGAVFVTGIGRANDVPNAQIVLDEDAINYVYVNNVNNDFKKIEPSNLLTQLQTLEQVVNTGNTVSNTINVTGLVTTDNVEVGSNISIAGLTTNKIPIIGAGNFLENSTIGRSNGTIVISSDVEILGNITVDGNSYTVESNNLVINDRIIGIANNNTSHELDVGIIMQHPGKNIALIHHGESQGDSDPHDHTFTIGYTQNTVTDNHIFDDSNLITVEILGNLITQNNLTVTTGSYYGDGTTLTGVALSSDLTDNASRISVLETDLTSNATRVGVVETDLASNASRVSTLEDANTVQGGLISTLTTDLASNASRVSTLEDANTVQGGLISTLTTDLTSNASRVSTLEDANTVQGGLISTLTTDLTSNASRVSTLEDANTVQAGLISTLTTDLTSNASRVSTLEDANTVQAGLISTLTTDLASNASRVSTLEDANTVQGGLISSLTTDLASNASRIGVVETDLASNASRIGVVETDLASNASRIGVVETDMASNVIRISDLEAANTIQGGLITAIEIDVTSNALRISSLEASNVDIWSNLASNVTRIETLETANTVQAGLITSLTTDLSDNAGRITTLEDANTVQAGLITAIETDMTSNSGRIDALEPRVTNLEASNVDIWSNLASNVTRIENLETSNANIWSNLASNVTRIGNLETNLSDNSSRIDALTLGDVVDVGNVTSNTVQFINATTSLVASGNVVVTGNVTSTTGRINKVATVGTTKTFVVTVSGGVFYIDGVQQDTLELHQYQTYIFDQSDASNATHPIRFSTTTNGTHNGGAEYQFGVSHTGTPGSAGAFTTFVVPVGAPSTLHYYCENHSGMGSSLSVSALAELIVTGRTVVSGNVEASSFIGDGSQLTNIASNLQAITDNGNVTSNSIQFTNTGTSIKASGTIEAVSFTGDGSQLTGIATTLQAVSDNGNVTSNTILLSNVTTGLVADGNVHALKFIGDGSELSGITPTLSAVLDTGNTSSNTILLTNVTTGLVADGNVHALKFIGSGSELTDIATTLQAVSDNSNSTSNTLLLTNATTGLVADGNVHALKFIGDGSELQNLPNAGVWETNEEQEIYYTGNNVGISNANPGHNLSVGSNLYVDDTGSNVLVISGNAAMSSLTLGQFSIVASYGLDDILNTSNVSSNTMQLTNATTGLVVSSNIVVTGNVTAGYLYGDASNVTGIAANLHQIVENGNVTSNTVQFSNATTGLVTTANVEVGGELTVSGNLEVGNSNSVLPTLVQTIAGTSTGVGNAIVVDPSGSVYVTGQYSSTSTVSLGNNLNLPVTSGGDIFIVKYNSSGTAQWFQTIAGTDPYDEGTDIAVDSGGNVYVTGYYDSTSTVSLGNNLNLPVSSGYDVYIVKYNSSGTAQWYQTISGNQTDVGNGIEVDSGGNVYVTGNYSSTTAVSLGNNLDLPVSYGNTPFIVKYNSSGTAQWYQTISPTETGRGYGIAVDSGGNVYVTGFYTYTTPVSLGNGLELPATGFGNYDVYIVKYDTSGTAQWYKTIAGTYSDSGNAIAVDSGGNVYVTGYYNSTTAVSLGNNLNLPVSSGGTTDTFIIKYDSSGTAQWYQTIQGSLYEDSGKSIAVDSGGDVYVTGYYNSTTAVSLGNNLNLPVSSGIDGFIVKYNSSGTAQWYQTISGTSSDVGYDIAVDSGGNVYVTGYYNSTSTVSLGNNLNLPVSSGTDVFIVKYSPIPILFIDATTARVGVGTSTPEATLHVEGNAYVSSNLAVSGSKFTYDNSNTTVFTGTATAAANEIGYLDMSTSSTSNNIHVKVYIKYGQSSALGEAEYSFYIRPNAANTSLIYDYKNQLGPITPVVYRTDATELHSGGTPGVVRFGYSIASAQNVLWRVEVQQRSNNVTFYPTNTGSAMVTTGLVQVTPTPFTRFDSNVMASGNVGIGTSTINERLQIGGNIGLNWNNDTRIIMNYDNSYRQGIELDAGTRNMTLFSTTDDSGGSIIFKTRAGAGSSDTDYGTERMRIEGNGDVGIGTTSPSATLELFKGFALTGLYDTATLKFSTTNTTNNWDVGSIRGAVKLNAGGTSGYPGGLVFATKSPSVGAGDGLTDKMVIDANGNVGIGTTDPGAKFQVNGLGFADVASSSRSYFLYSSTGLVQNTGTWGNASIYATDSIVTGSYIASIQGTVGASDERIKKEVSDINDGSALETLRLLKPKQYKYKDEISRGTDPVWGFIAQEVRETLPYATQIRSEYIPNIYELATVSSSNVITFTNFNTSNLMSNANTISLRTVKGTSERVNIVEVVDEQTIRVDKDLSESIGSVDESGNVMTGNEIFVYGQEVDDFVYLKKDAIWTIATAALQEVDRQLQTEKARNDDLEARILALENA